MPTTHASDQPPADAVKLRIRTENNQKQIKLTLLPTDTLAAVYKYIRPHLLQEKNQPGKTLELYTSFPKKVFPEQMTGTLKELGLAPTCALNVRFV